MQNRTTVAVLKFYNPEKGFGFAVTAQGDLRIGRGAVRPEQVADLLPGVELTLEVLQGRDGLAVRSISDITIPLQRGVVKWFNETKNFGFIAGMEGFDVFLHGDTAAAAGVLPWKDLVVDYFATKSRDGRLQAARVNFPTLVEEVAAAEQPVEPELSADDPVQHLFEASPTQPTAKGKSVKVRKVTRDGADKRQPESRPAAAKPTTRPRKGKPAKAAEAQKVPTQPVDTDHPVLVDSIDADNPFAAGLAACGLVKANGLDSGSSDGHPVH